MNETKGTCVPCDVKMYQNVSGQSLCEKCPPEMSSTTTGAENCYFNHSMFIFLNIHYFAVSLHYLMG